MSKRSRSRHASPPPTFAPDDDAVLLSPFDDPLLEDDVDDALGEDDDDDEDDEDDDPSGAPCVVIGTLRDFGTTAPDVFSRLAQRPVWFLVDEHAPLVGLFERYPEEPMDAAAVTAVLSFLRTFSSSHAEGLQALLGPTERIHYGFHTSASLEEAIESFEDDGFDVLLGIEDGEVVLPDR